ncbi:MAG: HlyC/CorC family transporter [Candidatus Cloacimonetes bacterium]|nr:HlyC/CorC family transporter [Candidatus Cloacimonadota bacterium]
MEILFLLGLVLLNGIFAMSEMALMTARRARLKRMAEQGDSSAAVAINLGENPTRFLSTIQIGITAIGVTSGIVGESALAEPLALVFQNLGMNGRFSDIAAMAIVVPGITYFSIVLGELLPKRLAQFHAEEIATILAKPISQLAYLSSPFVYILSKSTDTVLRWVGKHDSPNPGLTEEDIHSMLAEGSEAGVIEKQEHDLVKNVFRLDERPISSLMTPRTEIVFLDLNHSMEMNLEKVLNSEHSRFPVCKGGLHEVVGVISSKRLLKHKIRNGSASDGLEEYLVPAVYVPESLTGMRLLGQLRESGVQMVFVMDEYGEILGLVTLRDVLEALAGEFKPIDPLDVWAVEQEDGSFLLDGLIPIAELKDRLGLGAAPEEQKIRYNTLSGMLMWLLGSLPKIGDRTEWEGWVFEVMVMDGNRIEKVRAFRQS